MGLKNFHPANMEGRAKAAFATLDGMAVNLLTNTDDSPFWYETRAGSKRYKHEKASPGDRFFDGNNGDEHVVVAVDHDNERLAYRNIDQGEMILNIAVW